VPQSENDTGYQLVLPIRVRGNRLINQRENPFRLIVYFYVNVELDVLILGLFVKCVGASYSWVFALY